MAGVITPAISFVILIMLDYILYTRDDNHNAQEELLWTK